MTKAIEAIARLATSTTTHDDDANEDDDVEDDVMDGENLLREAASRARARARDARRVGVDVEPRHHAHDVDAVTKERKHIVERLRSIAEECAGMEKRLKEVEDEHRRASANEARERARARALDASARTIEHYARAMSHAMAMNDAITAGEFAKACDFMDAVVEALRRGERGARDERVGARDVVDRARREVLQGAKVVKDKVKRACVTFFTDARDRAREVGRVVVAAKAREDEALEARAERVSRLADVFASSTDDVLSENEADDVRKAVGAHEDDAIEAERAMDDARRMVEALDWSAVARARAVCKRLGESDEDFASWFRETRSEQLRRDVIAGDAGDGAQSALERAVGYFVIQLAVVDAGVALSRADVDLEWASASKALSANFTSANSTAAMRATPKALSTLLALERLKFDVRALRATIEGK